MSETEPKRPFRPWLHAPLLTRTRIVLAFVIAVLADGVQILLGPLGWAFIDQGIDLVAMVMVTLLLGFHVFFLPTFLLELVPVVDFVPTWTGCVAVVVVLRRRQQSRKPVETQAPEDSNVIDV